MEGPNRVSGMGEQQRDEEAAIRDPRASATSSAACGGTQNSVHSNVQANDAVTGTRTMLKWTCYAAPSKNRTPRPASLDEREEKTAGDIASSACSRIGKSSPYRSKNLERERESSPKQIAGVRKVTLFCFRGIQPPSSDRD